MCDKYVAAREITDFLDAIFARLKYPASEDNRNSDAREYSFEIIQNRVDAKRDSVPFNKLSL